MTKYVLSSGGLTNLPEKKKKFFDEVFADLGNNPKLLICNFAIPRGSWEKSFVEDVEYFKTNYQDLQPQLELAYPDKFVEQLQATNAIYINGGDDNLILFWLKKFNLPLEWDGKVIATNSASSHAVSKYFWTCDWRSCMDGLGILPIKFLAHYKSNYGATDPRGPIDWEKAFQELEVYGEKLPTYALEEGDYTVIKM